MEIVENYENNIKNGYFIQKWNNGKICEGYYINNEMSGWGHLDNLEIDIRGYFHKGILEGYGEVYNKVENIKYKGYWKNGILDGIGIQFDENCLYEGEFINSKINGIGSQIYVKESEKYEGEWKNGVYEGFGIYYYSSGIKYIGHFKNNCKEGIGELILDNGKKFFGFFKEDSRYGLGIYLNEKQNISICFYKGDKKDVAEKNIINKTKVSYKKWENNKYQIFNEKEFFDLLKSENKEKYISIFKLDFDGIIQFIDVI